MKKASVDLTENELETILSGISALASKADQFVLERLKKLENSLITQFNKSQEHVITAKCLFGLVEGAKTEMFNLSLPLSISGKEVEQPNLVHICLANSLISYLNKNEILKKLPKFDYTDSSLDFETHD